MRRWLLLFLSVFAFVAAPAAAQIDTVAEHAVLMDADTGQVLWQKDGYAPMPPASMSKLMTLEMLFQRLKDGRVKLNDTFLVSERAWRTQGSRMFLQVGSRVTVENLIRGIIIQSGNDACMTVAESLGGTMENFADMMNKRAKELGLKNSHFVNPDGLPDPPGQIMSAYDLAVLARHLSQDYPQFYHFFSEPTFTWNNIQQHNRNLFLFKFHGADGLKTGHTDEAGYGVTASAKVGNQRLILVLSGLRYPDLDKMDSRKADLIAENRRGEEAAKVMNLAFMEFRSYPLFKANEVVDQLEVWGGSHSVVPVTAGKALNVLLPVESRSQMKVSLRYNKPLMAPIAQGQQVGTLVVTAPGTTMEVPVFATDDVKKAGIFGRVGMGLSGLFGKH